jgi:two-component system, sensor histidine kinase and response regulator
MKTKDFTILVADDNTENLRMISSILLAEGYKLSLANDGEGVFKTTEENKIDLILMNIAMPGPINGFQVCTNLKKNLKTKEIPVIFMSDSTDGNDIIEGFRTGGVDFVSKPFNKQELLARVSNHIKVKNIIDELNSRIKYLEHSRADFMKWLYGLANSIEPVK